MLAFASLATLAFASSHALVVTNNRSLDLGRPDLRYADDDGAQYASLFGDAFGADRVELLTIFDPESRRLYPHWAERAATPTSVWPGLSDRHSVPWSSRDDPYGR